MEHSAGSQGVSSPAVERLAQVIRILLIIASEFLVALGAVSAGNHRIDA